MSNYKYNVSLCFLVTNGNLKACMQLAQNHGAAEGYCQQLGCKMPPSYLVEEYNHAMQRTCSEDATQLECNVTPVTNMPVRLLTEGGVGQHPSTSSFLSTCVANQRCSAETCGPAFWFLLDASPWWLCTAGR